MSILEALIGVRIDSFDLDLVTEGYLDSLVRVALIDELERHFKLEIPGQLLSLESIRTIEGISALLDAAGAHATTVPPTAARSAGSDAPSLLLPLRDGVGRPLFLVHGILGRAASGRALLPVLDTARPIFCLQARAFVTDDEPQSTIEAMAETYVSEIRSQQRHGPYAVGGCSFGALVAYEMARQLRAQGAEVDLVLLIDPRASRAAWPERFEKRGSLTKVLGVPGYIAREPRQRVPLLVRSALGRARRQTAYQTDRLPARVARCQLALLAAQDRYVPGPLDADISLVEIRDSHPWHPRASELLGPRVRGAIHVEYVRGTHTDLLAPGKIQRLGEPLGALLRRSPGTASEGDATQRRPAATSGSGRTPCSPEPSGRCRPCA